MELASYVEHLRRDLSEAAAAGGPEAHEAAQRLAMALDPAVRMTLLEALSDASAEITGALEDTSIEVRMKGRDPEFVVEQLEPVASSAPAEDPPSEEPQPEDEDLAAGDETLARVTVRIPESLKARAEELASAGSQSLNAWIVQAVRFAARERAINIDIDLGSRLFAPGAPPPPPPPGPPSPPGVRVRMPRHVQGWSR